MSLDESASAESKANSENGLSLPNENLGDDAPDDLLDEEEEGDGAGAGAGFGPLPLSLIASTQPARGRELFCP